MEKSIKQSNASEVFIDLGEKWEDVIKNNHIDSDRKYEILKKKAENLDEQAKEQEEMQENEEGEVGDETVQLYLDSINTKLALLTKI